MNLMIFLNFLNFTQSAYTIPKILRKNYFWIILRFPYYFEDIIYFVVYQVIYQQFRALEEVIILYELKKVNIANWLHQEDQSFHF